MTILYFCSTHWLFCLDLGQAYWTSCMVTSSLKRKSISPPPSVWSTRSTTPTSSKRTATYFKTWSRFCPRDPSPWYPVNPRLLLKVNISTVVIVFSFYLKFLSKDYYIHLYIPKTGFFLDIKIIIYEIFSQQTLRPKLEYFHSSPVRGSTYSSLVRKVSSE